MLDRAFIIERCPRGSRAYQASSSEQEEQQNHDHPNGFESEAEAAICVTPDCADIMHGRCQ